MLKAVIQIMLTDRRIGDKSLKEWLTVFEGAAFPYGPINNLEEVFSDPQVGAISALFLFFCKCPLN